MSNFTDGSSVKLAKTQSAPISSPNLSKSSSPQSFNGDQSVKPYQVRMVTCGEPSVGKTSILKRINTKRFNPNEPPTVGAEYIHSDFPIQGTNQTMQLQIWDTAGEENYRSLVPLYFKNSNGALLVFDQTSRRSFQSLQYWIELYKESNADDPIFFVVANKSDLLDNQTDNLKPRVSFSSSQYCNDDDEVENGSNLKDEALYWATSQGYPMYETSAKTGEGLENLMNDIIRTFSKKVSEMDKVKKNHRILKFPKNEESGGEKKCSC